MSNEIVRQNSGFLVPAADIQTTLMRYQAVKDFISGVLREGVDYGKIPGSEKPVLLKAGAEKMAAFFGLTVRFELADKIEDWTGESHEGEPFFYYRYKCSLWRGDALIAEGEGSANSWEKKYRYRQAERVCPSCGKATIIKGKAEYGGGWVCFTKKGGCGAKFSDNAPEIVNQDVGQVKNPDPADIVNTLQKIGQKRALVAPILIATNTSDYFTQDVEDFIDAASVESKPAMTYEQAAARLTPKGKRFDELTLEQLNFIIASEKSSAESREAARIVLEHDFSAEPPTDSDADTQDVFPS